MPVREPESLDDLTCGYLSWIAARILRIPAVEVTGFTVTPDPFEFRRFGEKKFFDTAFDYCNSSGDGRSNVILRVLPRMDAVMMVMGDTEHRELRAFEAGLYEMMPATFHLPYVHVIHRPDRGQYWAFAEDVRPQMAALGMHSVLPDEKIRTILSHLAAFSVTSNPRTPMCWSITTWTSWSGPWAGLSTASSASGAWNWPVSLCGSSPAPSSELWSPRPRRPCRAASVPPCASGSSRTSPTSKGLSANTGWDRSERGLLAEGRRRLGSGLAVIAVGGLFHRLAERRRNRLVAGRSCHWQ